MEYGKKMAGADTLIRYSPQEKLLGREPEFGSTQTGRQEEGCATATREVSLTHTTKTWSRRANDKHGQRMNKTHKMNDEHPQLTTSL